MVASAAPRQQPGLACEECRRRKARCDRVRPTCGICAEMGRQCVVVGTRSQRGPKKGHLKDLRSRVAALEQQLINQSKSLDGDVSITPRGSNETTPERETAEEVDMGAYASPDMDMDINADAFRIPMPDTPELFSGVSEREHRGDASPMTPNNFRTSGMSLPTPPVDMLVNPMMTSADGELNISDLMKGELDLLYFERVYPIVPMVHKRHYFRWAGDENPSPARACLRSAMRTVAAAVSAQSPALGDALYATTRRMLEVQDAHGETGLPWRTGRPRGQQPPQIQHELIQAWLLLAHFDFVRRPEHQALLTAGRAFRLLQLSRLLEIDAHDNDAPIGDHPTLSNSPIPDVPAEDDWIVTEEKRRTLWAAFILDRLYSTLNDRPLMLHEEIICTRLPMPEADFQDGHHPVRMAFLADSESSGDLCGTLPPLAECVVLSNLFRRCIAHRRLAQSITLSGCEVKSHDFWTRHEWLAAATAAATRQRLEVSSTPSGCDPLMAFNRIIAYTASISLSDTAEANPWQTLDDHLLAVTYKELAYQAALELVRLLKAAPRIAFFKTHPFTPHTLSLVSDFLTVATPPLSNSEAERLEGVSVLHRSLKYLSDVNLSARELLQRFEVPRPASATVDIATPDWTGVDFTWNEPNKTMDMGGYPFLTDAVW